MLFELAPWVHLKIALRPDTSSLYTDCKILLYMMQRHVLLQAIHKHTEVRLYLQN